MLLYGREIEENVDPREEMEGVFILERELRGD